MKKKLSYPILFAVSVLFSTLTLAADTKPWADFYGHYMHEIFESFSNVQINLTLSQHDIADLYLGQMQEGISNAEKYIPPFTKDGKKIDREQYLKGLEDLSSQVKALRSAIKERKSEAVKSISSKISEMCSSCHSQARLNELFKKMGKRTIFETYMHEVSEHFDLAKMILIETGDTSMVDKELQSIIFYLELLEDTAPDYGPEGIIMERDIFISRLKEIQQNTKSAKKVLMEKKSFDFESYKKELNGFCVLCHESDRIK